MNIVCIRFYKDNLSPHKIYIRIWVHLIIQLYVLSSFAIILTRKRELVFLTVLWLFLTVPWVGLQCLIELFPDLTQSIIVKTKNGIIS